MFDGITYRVFKMSRTIVFLCFLSIIGLPTLYGQVPANWQVVPSSFNNSMVVTAVLNMQSTQSRDPDDVVAAFIGDEVRGVASPSTYVNSKDIYVVSLIIYSNDNGPITFKLFNKASNTVSSAVIGPINFEADSRVGSFDNPLVIKDNYVPTELNLLGGVVKEYFPVGTLVGAFEVIDLDLADVHIFSFVDDKVFGDNTFFEIKNNDIYTKSTFVYANKSSYTIQVQAEDPKRGKIVKIFIILVKKDNNDPTDLKLSEVEVYENLPAGTLVGTFEVIDLDLTDIHILSFVDDKAFEGNTFFDIKNSELYTKSTFVYADKSSYTIQVQAEDHKKGKIVKTFVILVKKDEIDDVLEFNNLITHNNDGYNDVLKINYISLYVDYDLFIYNKQGQLVFNSNNYLNDWNGGNNPDGVYYLYFSGKNKRGKQFTYKEALRIINN